MTRLWKGRAKRLDDIDLPAIGHTIGVDEDRIHAVLEVESRGSGFDRQGRVAMLFEPHLFWRALGAGDKRDRAERAGLAYPNWRPGTYPKDSYPRLEQAVAIDETAALLSASWGLAQVLGSHYRALGYERVQAMVADFADSEAAQLRGMVRFILANGLDDELRRLDWAGFARGYNGKDYARHNYHGRLAAAYEKWRKIPDTPWSPEDSVAETKENDPEPGVHFPPPEAPKAEVPKPGFWVRFWRALIGAA